MVCSPLEAGQLRTLLGDDFILVTPADAIRDGAGYLVIGRPVTQAKDPVSALEAINGEIRSVI